MDETPEASGTLRTPKKLSKRDDPEFAKKTLYVRIDTMRDAFRRYQIELGGTEESELVEMVLRQYAEGASHA